MTLGTSHVARSIVLTSPYNPKGCELDLDARDRARVCACRAFYTFLSILTTSHTHPTNDTRTHNLWVLDYLAAHLSVEILIPSL